MSNTPASYAWYIAGLVFQWLKAQGGLVEMEKKNIAKAKLLYDFLDASAFFKNPVRKSDRSRMNIPFTLADSKLDGEFLKGAEARGMLNPEGVREVGRIFRAEFDKLGFTTRWVDLPPAVQRAGHLVAAREGKQGKRLLLIGHLDTVFEKDSPVQRWERKGDRIRGPGVSDMKGGDVIIVEALRALAKLHALDNTSITIVFTGDEEKPGSPLEVARAELVSAAKRSDLALGFEGIVKDKQGK